MTKIVCTIGPASDSEDTLRKLIKAGMSVARLNFSHGTHEEHGKVIKRIRAISEELDVPIAILLDLPGPKIRIGRIKEGSINLEYGSEFTLTTRKVPGDVKEVSVNYPDLPEQLEKGDPVLLADGEIELLVLKVTDTDIKTRVLIGGDLSPRKGVNLPTRSLNISAFTKADRKHLLCGIENGVDIVALSFVQNARDVKEVRGFIKRKKSDIPIIAKIEKHDALDNIDEILELVDGIMVARGDLGVEIPLEEVPIAQKELIKKANEAGKTVITATQMLKSMVENPRPTRAEAADVTNAILDGTDAVMLSEETAVGSYPDKAVSIMKRISEQTVKSDIFGVLISRLRDHFPPGHTQSVCLAGCNISGNIGARAIVVFTDSGQTARHISHYRPRQRILALTPKISTYRNLSLVWGVTPVLIGKKIFSDKNLEAAAKNGKLAGLIKNEDEIIILDEQSLSIYQVKA